MKDIQSNDKPMLQVIFQESNTVMFTKYNYGVGADVYKERLSKVVAKVFT